MANKKFEPEYVRIVRECDTIKCPHCRLLVSLKNVYLEDDIEIQCPHCKNVIDKNYCYSHEILFIPEHKDMPVKCLNCNFVFITNTDDFYYKPGNIKCPKCKHELSRKDVIEVYKTYVENERNSFSNRHPILAPIIVIAVIFFIIYIILILFS